MSSSQVKPKRQQVPKFRLVCGTIFNMEYDFDAIKPHIQFMCKGHEICPTTGRHHWQYYMYAGVGKTEKTWRKLLYPHHVDMCKGNLHSNQEYCSKAGKWDEWGVKPMGDGMTRAIFLIKEEIDAGKSVNEIMEHPDAFETCIRYKKGLQEYEAHMRKKAMMDRGYLMKHVEVIIGPSGTGKTRSVYDQHGFHNVYAMPDNKGQWAGSYAGQPVVVFDDVCSGDIMPITHFLRITDGYPIEVAIKGGFVAWTPTHVYFTSNQPLESWWPTADPKHLDAVKRRISFLRNQYLSDQ